MKQLIIFLEAVSLTAALWAQSPEKISFREVIEIIDLSNLSVTNTVNQDLHSMSTKATLGDYTKQVRNSMPDASKFLFSEMNPEDGANTMNYLSKWNGDTLISSSFFNDKSIGITNLPTMHIYDNDPVLVIQDLTQATNFAEAYIKLGESSSVGALQNHWKIGYDKSDFIFSWVNKERFKITAAGNVGIGIDIPDHKLTVAGIIESTNGGFIFPDGTIQTTSIKTYSVGDMAQGGIVFWVDETAQHGLACAKEDCFSGGIIWCHSNVKRTNARGDGLYAGEANTSIIIAVEAAIEDEDIDAGVYAARLCNELQVTEGGITYGDWYLPSLYELKLMYQNKSIINDTAVLNGGNPFAEYYYWSSTELSEAGLAWNLDFRNGFWFDDEFFLKYNVRAVRAF